MAPEYPQITVAQAMCISASCNQVVCNSQAPAILQTGPLGGGGKDGRAGHIADCKESSPVRNELTDHGALQPDSCYPWGVGRGEGDKTRQEGGVGGGGRRRAF